jgi:hypothetical protein
MAELALDHHERNALMRHLDCVGVSELMVGCEPPSDTRRGGPVMQLLARR